MTHDKAKLLELIQHDSSIELALTVNFNAIVFESLHRIQFELTREWASLSIRETDLDAFFVEINYPLLPLNPFSYSQLIEHVSEMKVFRQRITYAILQWAYKARVIKQLDSPFKASL